MTETDDDLIVDASGKVKSAVRLDAKKQAQQRAEEELTLPLFELASIMPKEREMNELKLKAFLKKNGIYCIIILIIYLYY